MFISILLLNNEKFGSLFSFWFNNAIYWLRILDNFVIWGKSENKTSFFFGTFLVLLRIGVSLVVSTVDSLPDTFKINLFKFGIWVIDFDFFLLKFDFFGRINWLILFEGLLSTNCILFILISYSLYYYLEINHYLKNLLIHYSFFYKYFIKNKIIILFCY